MTCPHCDSPETIVTDRIQTEAGVCLECACNECLRTFEVPPVDSDDRESDRNLCENPNG